MICHTIDFFKKRRAIPIIKMVQIIIGFSGLKMELLMNINYHDYNEIGHILVLEDLVMFYWASWKSLNTIIALKSLTTNGDDIMKEAVIWVFMVILQNAVY